MATVGIRRAYPCAYMRSECSLEVNCISIVFTKVVSINQMGIGTVKQATCCEKRAQSIHPTEDRTKKEKEKKTTSSGASAMQNRPGRDRCLTFETWALEPTHASMARVNRPCGNAAGDRSFVSCRTKRGGYVWYGTLVGKYREFPLQVSPCWHAGLVICALLFLESGDSNQCLCLDRKLRKLRGP